MKLPELQIIVSGECGWINQNLKLSDREWTCNSCGVVHDRDVNASRNILKEGLKIYGKGLAITKVERKSDVSNNAHSMKPEAQPIASGVGG
jgi:putative transposase